MISHEAHCLRASFAMISHLEERVPFLMPIKHRESKGCVEKWLLQIENQMQGSVREVILQCLESMSTPRAEWVQDWPCQGLLTSASVAATKECVEAIKGGSVALKQLQAQYETHQANLVEVIKGHDVDQLTRSTVKSMIFHDMRIADTVSDLLKREVKNDKEFGWKVKPRYA